MSALWPLPQSGPGILLEARRQQVITTLLHKKYQEAQLDGSPPLKLPLLSSHRVSAHLGAGDQGGESVLAENTGGGVQRCSLHQPPCLLTYGRSSPSGFCSPCMVPHI